ncbi:hypothetical protein Bhyg_14919 [Pseudolycoriella hygida]|uniref:Uncharacterized protein n=1 Tax=Pseudolycoriella hygida TaxID=35572 RepID=A0A9Q0MR07_9DIPT|nr:hypothetical protein Bhyg_14919 [Pseudolycoriella hygida]
MDHITTAILVMVVRRAPLVHHAILKMSQMVMEILFHILATINHHPIYLTSNRHHHLSCRIIDRFINVTMATWVIVPRNRRTEIHSICHHPVGDNVSVRTVIAIFRIRCVRSICKIRIIFQCIE